MRNDASHPGRAEPRRGSRRRRAGPLAAGLIGVGLLAAACGGPAGPGVANAGPASSASPSASASGSALAYSRCMRAHGITKFPDPDSNGNLGLNAGPGSGLDPNSPQFKAAASRPTAIIAVARGPARRRWLPRPGSGRPGWLASFFMAPLP